MGVFDIFRRKKKEEVDFGADGSAFDAGANPEPTSFNEDFRPAFSEPGLQPTFSQPGGFQPQPFSQPNLSNNDIQLILTKLELINQRLEVMDRRLQLIEQIAKESR